MVVRCVRRNFPQRRPSVPLSVRPFLGPFVRRGASRRTAGSRVRAHAVVYAIVPTRFRASPLSRASPSHNRESNVPVRVSFPHRDARSCSGETASPSGTLLARTV